MRSKQFVWIAILVLAGTTGCAMCDNAQDWTYSAFGGKWQRDNPHSGRVASLFDPAGGQVVEQGSPTEADPVPETAEEAVETDEPGEPLVDQQEEPAESAEPQMEGPQGEAAEPALPETTKSKKPADAALDLPVMSEDAAETPKSEDAAGLLPPLELPPQ